MKTKGYCEICGEEIEVEMCCSGYACGCLGLPINPPVCSEECYNIFMSPKHKDNNLTTVSLTSQTEKNPKI